MPTVKLYKGRPRVVDVVFSNGEMFGETNYRIEWAFLDLRQIVLITKGTGGTVYPYKVVEIADTVVLDRKYN